jgi:uncharacterized membrane protein
MISESETLRPKQLTRFLFWSIVLAISTYFYFDNAVAYLFGYRNERFGDSFFHNQVWFVAHIIGATCSLFLGPIQFWKVVRSRFLRYHRIAGKIYIAGSLLAGITALRLSVINDCVGCRYSLLLLSLFFLLTTSAAWYAIRKKNILVHQQFMVRSYTCALAFVFVRLYQIIPMDFLFGAIENPDTRAVVIEWIFSFMPLFLVEIVMIWLPSLAKTNSLQTEGRR